MGIDPDGPLAALFRGEPGRPPSLERLVLDHYTADELRELARRARRAQPPERFSMSALRQGANCLLSLRLDVEAGGVAGIEATWGRAFHEVAAAVAFACSMTGRPTLDVTEAERITQAVFSRMPDPLDPEGDALVRAWVRDWASTAVFLVDADEFIAEDLWVYPLAGSAVSAKLDLVTRTGGLVEIDDYKTGRPLPKSIEPLPQPRIYAWTARQRWPDVESVMVTERYIRHGVPRSAMYDAAYIDDVIEPWLVGLLGRVHSAYQRAEFEPRPGSWCARCAMPDRCPLPETSRPASLRTPQDVQALVDAVQVYEARAKRARDAAREVIKAFGLEAVRSGDRALGYHDKTKNVTDYRAVSGVLEAVGYDGGIDAFKTAQTRPEFGWETITEEDTDADE